MFFRPQSIEREYSPVRTQSPFFCTYTKEKKKKKKTIDQKKSGLVAVLADRYVWLRVT